jgi:hypothetical protein
MLRFKNVLKLLDSVNGSLLTINKITSSRNEFQGIYGNFELDGKMKKVMKGENEKNGNVKDSDTKIKSDILGSIELEKDKELRKNNITNTVESGKDVSQGDTTTNLAIDMPLEDKEKQLNKESETETIKDEPFLIKSDKLKFHGKSSRIPVTSFSRAMNMGMLGISLLGNTLSQAFIDKV